MRCQMGNPDVRQDQEAAVVDFLPEVLLPALLVPSDPQIPDRHLPGGRREGRSAHDSQHGVLRQIPDLGPAQRPLPQIMIPRKERVPQSGLFLCRDPHDLEWTDLRKSSVERLRHRLPKGIRLLRLPPSRDRPSGRRKDDLLRLLELVQEKPGIHLLGLPVRPLPPPGPRTPSVPGSFEKRRTPPPSGSCRGSMYRGSG